MSFPGLISNRSTKEKVCMHKPWYGVILTYVSNIYDGGKWKTRKAGTGTGTGTETETETEIRKRSSDLKVSIVRVDGNSMQVCW